MWEVECPACGALVEAPDLAELIVRTKKHTLDAHQYDIPPAHVESAAVHTS